MRPSLSVDQPLQGYVFWVDPSRANPYRWAAERTPNAYDKRHGSHHGGARTPEEARVAAERHAYLVAQDADLHKPQA